MRHSPYLRSLAARSQILSQPGLHHSSHLAGLYLMCGGYDNRATIVAPSSRVLDALGAEVGDDHIVVYA